MIKIFRERTSSNRRRSLGEENSSFCFLVSVSYLIIFCRSQIDPVTVLDWKLTDARPIFYKNIFRAHLKL